MHELLNSNFYRQSWDWWTSKTKTMKEQTEHSTLLIKKKYSIKYFFNKFESVSIMPVYTKRSKAIKNLRVHYLNSSPLFMLPN